MPLQLQPTSEFISLPTNLGEKDWIYYLPTKKATLLFLWLKHVDESKKEGFHRKHTFNGTENVLNHLWVP